MNNLELFMKDRQKPTKDIDYPATSLFVDEKGKIIPWKLRVVPSKRNDEISEECLEDIPIPGKRNQYRQKLNVNKYTEKLVCESVVFPDLNDKRLQDSYGVLCAEDLLHELVKIPGEYTDLLAKVQEINGFDPEKMDKAVEEAKNS